jgi:hypothetical protein
LWLRTAKQSVRESGAAPESHFNNALIIRRGFAPVISLRDGQREAKEEGAANIEREK